MYLKAVFVTIDILAFIAVSVVSGTLSKVKEEYAKALQRAMISALAAIAANVCIALFLNATLSTIAYSLYYVSIDWILYFLCRFSTAYCEYYFALKNISRIFLPIVCLDSVYIYTNVFLHHHFTVARRVSYGAVFMQAEHNTLPFYMHLGFCYLMVATIFSFILYKLVSSYGFYRIKYALIFVALAVLIILNGGYIYFALPLDISIVFYGVSGIIIYFSITRFIPVRLLNHTLITAVDGMHEGIILFDVNDECIFANAFAKNCFDIDVDSYDFTCEPAKTVMDEILFSGGASREAVYVQKTRGFGKYTDRHFSVRFNQFSDYKGRKLGSSIIIEDITEEAYYLKEINEAMESADKANDAKSSFLASMSHEIRTPLNSVLGMNEMILRTSKDPEILEYAETIRTSGTTLLGLINDILDFSKIEAGKMEIQIAGYNPMVIAKDSLDTFRPLAEAKGLYLKVDCDENTPSLLKGDEQKIRQIVSNIISNAIKYTKQGGVTVNIYSTPEKDGNTDIVFSVQDTGIGIAEEDIGKLFDAFKRINEEKNASIQGTGLGLSITKELIELMNGKITVTSKLGEGSCFTISIPQEISSYKAVGAMAEEKPAEAYEYRETFRAPGARILVVDDVAVNLKVVTALLKKTEIQVVTAGGGNEAIEKCNNEKFDLILLDHRMPEPDGIATFKVISKEGMNTDTPVIALTANALSGAEQEYLNLGFADYLAKPIRSNELEFALLRNLPPDKVDIM